MLATNGGDALGTSVGGLVKSTHLAWYYTCARVSRTEQDTLARLWRYHGKKIVQATGALRCINHVDEQNVILRTLVSSLPHPGTSQVDTGLGLSA